MCMCVDKRHLSASQECEDFEAKYRVARCEMGAIITCFVILNVI